ncbi:MAG TPA: thioesterase family protein [Rhodanobacteraceae bacterium]|jgi:acyl-CoA thioester hydrolase|nr:thioesterase family protein [Rhodanobacteraceae bacterium]
MSSTGKLLIETPIELRWRDLDALNHVNNASFLTFFEEARLRWFASLSGPWTSEAAQPVLAAVHINYRRQLNWPGTVVAQLYCERIGNASLTIAHRLLGGGGDATLYADGSSVLVWIDPASGKPIKLPEPILAACQ